MKNSENIGKGHPDFSPTASKFPDIFFAAPRFRNPVYFVERPKITSQIYPKLSSGHHAIALTGPLGIGKTVTAIDYAYKERGQYMQGGILFMNASSPESLEEDCQRFFRDYLQEPTEQGTDTFLKWLKNQRNALVVLDHVYHPIIARNFISDNNHLLVTSLKRIAALNTIQVGGLDDNQGARLLLLWSGILPLEERIDVVEKTIRDSAFELSHLLGGIPSQLIIAGNYLEQTQWTIPRYLEAVKSAGRVISIEDAP